MTTTGGGQANGNEVTVGEVVHYDTANHPARTDSPEYVKARSWLMATSGGCYVCGAPADLSHPAAAADTSGLQDHHGGGVFLNAGPDAVPVLVALNLFPLEWSSGWGSDPAVVGALVEALNDVLARLGQAQYATPPTTQADVMEWVDSSSNANVKLCAEHHIGTVTSPKRDARGHTAVGIHNIPYPVWAYQLTCDWANWDMFAGTSGTLAVAPMPGQPGHAHVLHVAPEHPDQKLYADFGHGANTVVLTPSHPAAAAAARTTKYTA